MSAIFAPSTVKHDGDVSTLRIGKGMLLVKVDLKALRTFSGIEIAQTWAEQNSEYAGRHGEVIVSGDETIPVGVVVYFSYMSAMGCDRIESNEELYFLIKREYCYLMIDEGIKMLNGYLLVENVTEKNDMLVRFDEKSFWARVIHAGETDSDNAQPMIKEGDVVMYRMALEVKLEGLKKFMDADYRVLQRVFCVARRHDK